MRLRAVVATHPGQRARNEDAALSWVRRGLGVYAVADGVGGGYGGHLASRAAVRAFARSLARRLRGGEPLADACSAAVVDAGEAVARAVPDADRAPPGTTLTALCVLGSEAAIVHVGDSRAYRLRDGTLSPLTEDHSVTAELVRAHALGLTEAARHAHRNVLTQAVGAGSVRPQVNPVGLRPGDVVLLCTDGVYKAVPDDRLAHLLASEGAARRIVEEVVAREGEDNATALTVEVCVGAPRRCSRHLAAAALAMALAAAGALSQRSYFLGVEGGQVTLFRGLPLEVGGLRAYRAERTFATPLEEVAPAYRQRLQRGLWVWDAEEAVRIVEELRQEPR
ncbi:MAG: protein phosphatase 2C domain-containing protein [Armatimonadota bacterium]|nr:protein phosphatase 2C domain-containing protein [Armatimonadota bacterium]MDR5696659.1 protein phosphatase 2C domain-containing protein [Armatimonadota bacterium]